MRTLPFLFLAACPLLFAQESAVPPPFEPEAPARTGTGEDPFDPDTNAPKLIQVQVEYVELAHEKLTELLFMAKPATADASGLRQKLQELVKQGEAKVLETQLVTGRSGERAAIESVDEHIYPSEAEPPEIPNNITIAEKNPEVAAELLKAMAALMTPATPTSFETRNVGSALESEPTTGDRGRIIDLRFAPELSWKTGRTVWQERKDPLGNVSKIEVPQIYSIQVTTALTLNDGEYVLAGIATPKDQNGDSDFSRKIMVFVKADTLSVR